MYSSEDFKRLFIRYKGEKWYKPIRHCAVKVESFRNFIIYKFVNLPKYSYLCKQISWWVCNLMVFSS
ncbi:putative uncharacterized protein [Bacteroides sp. CAG:702]|nr:putative uncharacterized protein [Bacteroides sp. CAG:702]